MGRDHLVPCRDDAATASELAVRLRRLERIMEQIGSVLVPQIMKGDVDGFQQNSVVEQIVGAPTPQTWEPIVEGVQVIPRERVLNRTQEPTVDVLVLQIMEDDVEVVLHHRTAYWIVPWNRSWICQCTTSRMKSWPAPQIQGQIVDVGGPGIVREIPEEKVVERFLDSTAFGGADHDQQETPACDGRRSSSSSVPWRPERHSSWRQTVTRDGSVYFWHVHTRQTQWDPPKDDDGEDAHFDSEDVEEDDARGIGSRFHGSFRPRRFVRGWLLLVWCRVRAPPAVARLALVTVLAASHYSESSIWVPVMPPSCWRHWPMPQIMAKMWRCSSLSVGEHIVEFSATDQGGYRGSVQRFVTSESRSWSTVPQILEFFVQVIQLVRDAGSKSWPSCRASDHGGNWEVDTA